jgi:hypothetical protein
MHVFPLCSLLRGTSARERPRAEVILHNIVEEFDSEAKARYCNGFGVDLSSCCTVIGLRRCGIVSLCGLLSGRQFPEAQIVSQHTGRENEGASLCERSTSIYRYVRMWWSASGQYVGSLCTSSRAVLESSRGSRFRPHEKTLRRIGHRVVRKSGPQRGISANWS